MSAPHRLAPPPPSSAGPGPAQARLGLVLVVAALVGLHLVLWRAPAGWPLPAHGDLPAWWREVTVRPPEELVGGLLRAVALGAVWWHLAGIALGLATARRDHVRHQRRWLPAHLARLVAAALPEVALATALVAGPAGASPGTLTPSAAQDAPVAVLVAEPRGPAVVTDGPAPAVLVVDPGGPGDGSEGTAEPPDVHAQVPPPVSVPSTVGMASSRI